MTIRSRRDLTPEQRRAVVLEEWLRLPKKAIKLAFVDLGVTGFFISSEVSWLLVPYLVWMFLTLVCIVVDESSRSNWMVDSIPITDRLLTLRTVIVLSVMHVSIVAGALWMYFDLH